jgi:oxygen-dependent protoporphyrinogen oxidase
MSNENSTKKRIAVVGAGISGLSAVLELEQVSPNADVILLESSARQGGVLRSDRSNGFLIEYSADMFTTDPSTALDLVKRLGHENQLVSTIPTEDRAFVATELGIAPIPRGLSLMLPGDVQAVLASPILSAAGKKRFLEEEHIPALNSAADESLESFAVRRFGQEMFDRLIQPLAGGIYTADPKTLSMRATMKRFLDMEQEFGSLIRAGRAKAENSDGASATSGARYGLFRAPKNGIGALIDWMVAAISQTDCRNEQTVVSVERTGRQWHIKTDAELFEVDGIILATSANVTGQLLRQVDSTLADSLSTITAASSAIVVQAFDKQQFGWTPKTSDSHFKGYGIVIPNALGRPVIASSFSSNKFSGRAPEDQVLVRSFIGGALNASLVDLLDEELTQLAEKELARNLRLLGSAAWSNVYRWRHCMPQYTLGHLDRVEAIESKIQSLAGIELAGNSYRGVGIPACIESGAKAATRLIADLTRKTTV